MEIYFLFFSLSMPHMRKVRELDECKCENKEWGGRNTHIQQVNDTATFLTAMRPNELR